jgi:hypothetical protein
MMSEKIDITRLTPEMLALILSHAGQHRITEEQVKRIVETGNLLSSEGTVNLIQYTAFLAQTSEGKNEQ